MKLEKITLHNFRCFKHLELELHPKLTVIVGENGAGKTALLDAIAIGFGRYLTKLPGITGRTLKDTDLRVNEQNRRTPLAMLSWQAKERSTTPLLTWSSSRKRDAAVQAADTLRDLPTSLAEAAKRGTKEIDAYTLELLQKEARGEGYFLPVVAYYGTNRAIRDDVKPKRRSSKPFLRFNALEGALEPDSRFQAAFEWFSAMEDMERREREQRRDFNYNNPVLSAVRSAIVLALPPGCGHPRTEIRPLRFVIDRVMPDGVMRTLRINQFSDGYRVMIGLVMDLARRMAQANHSLRADSAASESMLIVNMLEVPSVALIDEVDLHLHPVWQQRVLADLTRVFPGTQFIVTTHSPQVLSSVDAACIRRLQEEADPDTGERRIVVKGVDLQTKGVASSDLLAEIMGVDPIPAIKESRWVSDYHALIQQNLHETADGKNLRTRIEQHFGADHPVMRNIDRMVRLQQFKQRLPRDLGKENR